MRTEQIKVYKFNELPQETQKRIYEEYLSSGHFEHHWVDESIQAIKDWLDYGGVTVTDWSLSTYGHSYIDTDLCHEFIRGIKANHWDDYKDSYYLEMHMTNKFKEICKSSSGNILAAIQESIDEGLDCIIKDMEYQESFEYFKDTAEANEWEYLANGTQW